LGRFSARANIRAAVWDKPRSDSTVGVSRFLGKRGDALGLCGADFPKLTKRSLPTLSGLLLKLRRNRFDETACPPREIGQNKTATAKRTRFVFGRPSQSRLSYQISILIVSRVCEKLRKQQKYWFGA
jgi:hypothetical protein